MMMSPRQSSSSTLPARLLPLLVVACGLAWSVVDVVAAPAAKADQKSSPALSTAVGAGVDWVVVSVDAEVDAAFARAKAENKPLFLYWGAKWCPPCNQVKATLFNRQEFIARSRAFVPVYVDGDNPGAQKLGARFKVRAYPTMVLFTADGRELTRLPGEVGARQYTEVLSLGMAARRPIKEVVAEARDAARSRKLDAAEWRMLAFYSWETDERQIVAKAEVPGLLRQFAANCPPRYGETADRLFLQALAGGDAAAKPVEPATYQRVYGLLNDTGRTRAQMDLLSYQAVELVKALSGEATPRRRQLLDRFDGALKRLAADASLSRADRLGAQLARVELSRIGLDNDARPSLPPAMLAALRKQVEQDDREMTDGYERQAVVTTAAWMLTRAGLMVESDQLLKANLAKSHSPYYLMSALAGNAKARGDKAEALRWYAQAHERSEGGATRLQWGASHLAARVDLAPEDAAGIEDVARQVFTEAAGQPDAFYERSARSLQRVSGKLLAWAESAENAEQAQAVIGRLQLQVDGICRQLLAQDSGRAMCQRLLKPAGESTRPS